MLITICGANEDVCSWWQCFFMMMMRVLMIFVLALESCILGRSLALIRGLCG